MMKQLDGDGNVVVVMSPSEAIHMGTVMEAAIMAHGMGLTRLFDPEKEVMTALVSARFMFSDEEIIEHLLSIHADHEGDDIEGLREIYREQIPSAREFAKENGYVL